MANEYLRSWFPRPHSYEAFAVRINRLGEVLKHISSLLLIKNCPDDCKRDPGFVDSLQLNTTSGNRPNAAAKELTDKGYCSTKSIYNQKSKLHALAFSSPSHLSIPESLIVYPASENDLNVQSQYWRCFFIVPPNNKGSEGSILNVKVKKNQEFKILGSSDKFSIIRSFIGTGIKKQDVVRALIVITGYLKDRIC